jgi:hypothetical protein
MKKLKWGIGVFFMTTGLYLTLYFALCKVKYRELPLVYLFSDYLGPNGGFTYNKSIEWDEAQKSATQWDVIVLGASRAERSYDPAFFKSKGIQLFNWGTSAQSLQNSYLLLKQILEESPPKEVWLDIVPASFKPEALESTADLIQNVTSNELAMNLAWSSSDIRSVNLLSKRFFCENVKWEKKGRSQYHSQGFVSVSDSMGEKLYNECLRNVKHQRAYVQPSVEARLALKEIIELCRVKGVSLTCIISPTTPLYNMQDHAWMMAYLNELKKEHTFNIVDYAGDGQFQIPNDFYDEKHLNHSGALKFDSLFFNAIKIQ